MKTYQESFGSAGEAAHLIGESGFRFSERQKRRRRIMEDAELYNIGGHTAVDTARTIIEEASEEESERFDISGERAKDWAKRIRALSPLVVPRRTGEIALLKRELEERKKALTYQAEHLEDPVQSFDRRAPVIYAYHILRELLDREYVNPVRFFTELYDYYNGHSSEEGFAAAWKTIQQFLGSSNQKVFEQIDSEKEGTNVEPPLETISDDIFDAVLSRRVNIDESTKIRSRLFGGAQNYNQVIGDIRSVIQYENERRRYARPPADWDEKILRAVFTTRAAMQGLEQGHLVRSEDYGNKVQSYARERLRSRPRETDEQKQFAFRQKQRVRKYVRLDRRNILEVETGDTPDIIKDKIAAAIVLLAIKQERGAEAEIRAWENKIRQFQNKLTERLQEDRLNASSPDYSTLCIGNLDTLPVPGRRREELPGFGKTSSGGKIRPSETFSKFIDMKTVILAEELIQSQGACDISKNDFLRVVNEYGFTESDLERYRGNLESFLEELEARYMRERIEMARAGTTVSMTAIEQGSSEAMSDHLLTEDERRGYVAVSKDRAEKIIKEKTKQFWKRFAIHGKVRIEESEEGAEIILDKREDLDGLCALGFLKIAGIDAHDVQHVEPGQYEEGMTNIDTGSVPGVVLGRKDTIFIDHHGARVSRNTSATDLTYRLLVEMGFVERQPYLDKLVMFVDEIDNGTLDYSLEDFKHSNRTLVGLWRVISYDKLVEFFKDGHHPREILSDADLKKYGFDTDRQKASAYEYSLIKRTEEAFEKLKEDGFVLESPAYGKVIIDVGNQFKGRGFWFAKSHECGAYVAWNPDTNGFFVTALKPFHENFKIDQGIMVRGTMWLKPFHDQGPLNVSLEDILKQFMGEEYEFTGKLKEYLIQDKKERIEKRYIEAGGELPKEGEAMPLNVMEREALQLELDFARGRFTELESEFRHASPERQQELMVELEVAEKRYKECKARFIANDAKRYMQEREDVVDARIRSKLHSKIPVINELIKAWKWLGNQHIGKAADKIFGFKMQNRLSHFLSRRLSLRTFVSFGVLGSSFLLGGPLFAGAIGLAKFFTKRGFAAFGGGTSVYDMLEGMAYASKLGGKVKYVKVPRKIGGTIRQVKRVNLSIPLSEIDKAMQAIEARAEITGDPIDDPYYEILQASYIERVQSHESAPDQRAHILREHMDVLKGKYESAIRKFEGAYFRGENVSSFWRKVRKVAGFSIAALFGAGGAQALFEGALGFWAGFKEPGFLSTFRGFFSGARKGWAIAMEENVKALNTLKSLTGNEQALVKIASPVSAQKILIASKEKVPFSTHGTQYEGKPVTGPVPGQSEGVKMGSSSSIPHEKRLLVPEIASEQATGVGKNFLEESKALATNIEESTTQISSLEASTQEVVRGIGQVGSGFDKLVQNFDKVSLHDQKEQLELMRNYITNLTRTLAEQKKLQSPRFTELINEVQKSYEEGLKITQAHEVKFGHFIESITQLTPDNYAECSQLSFEDFMKMDLSARITGQQEKMFQLRGLFSYLLGNEKMQNLNEFSGKSVHQVLQETLSPEVMKHIKNVSDVALKDIQNRALLFEDVGYTPNLGTVVDRAQESTNLLRGWSKKEAFKQITLGDYATMVQNYEQEVEQATNGIAFHADLRGGKLHENHFLHSMRMLCRESQDRLQEAVTKLESLVQKQTKLTPKAFQELGKLNFKEFVNMNYYERRSVGEEHCLALQVLIKNIVPEANMERYADKTVLDAIMGELTPEEIKKITKEAGYVLKDLKGIPWPKGGGQV